MPTRFVTNNKVLPANSRVVDTAERAVTEIIPIQQRRYMNAFRVQGIEVLVYNLLVQGRPCSCQSAGKQINGMLNEEGKASVSDINRIITGNTEFSVTPYSEGYDPALPEETSPWSTGNKYQGVWDLVNKDPSNPFQHNTEGGPDVFGDDGPKQKIDLNELLGETDNTMYGHSDTACAICFGSGFVGGYSASHSFRHVIPANDVIVENGTLDMLARPLQVTNAYSWTQRVTLPKGAVSVDSTTVWNNFELVPGLWTIDGAPVKTDRQWLAFCDGRPHLLKFTFFAPANFTHVELQFAMSSESQYFEFPRRPSSANTDLLERMEPFQIVMSPNVQQLSDQDIIVESQQGKVLVVQNVSEWHTRQLNVLGPEARVRVIQPQEPFRILPARGRITAQKSTSMVIDNVNGIYRT